MRGDVGIAPYDRFYQSDKLQFEIKKQRHPIGCRCSYY